MGRVPIPLTDAHAWCLAILAGLLAAGASAEPDGERPLVRFDTTMGSFVVSLYLERSPKSVTNFLSYVDAGAYDDNVFHRVVPGFMVQTGGYGADLQDLDETTKVVNEAANGLANRPGTLALARSGDIDSAGRQFFINVGENAHLDHSDSSCTREDEDMQHKREARGLIKPQTCTTYGYAVFGEVVDGMDVVEDIEFAETRMTDDFDDLPIDTILIKSARRIAPGQHGNAKAARDK